MSKNGAGSKKDVRRVAAATRAVEQAKRTPEEQLKRLDAAGLTATKERAKLALRIKVRDTKPTPKEKK